MTNFNIHIHAYNDAHMLAECVESIREHLPDVPIYVFDGRYETFGTEDDPDVTPWHAPPGELFDAPIQFLDPGPLAPFPAREDRTLRADVATKTRWAFEHLPDDEWTLKLDTDELLHEFDVPWAELDDTYKYSPEIVTTLGRRVNISRLFKPRHWTPWVDDVLLPRPLFPRDTPLRVLRDAWETGEFRAVGFLRRNELPGVTIRNRGPDRPREYQEARADQLEAFGRDGRFMQLKEELEL